MLKKAFKMLNIGIVVFFARKISDIGIGQKCHIGASLLSGHHELIIF
jgi:hypothetical protein